MRIIKLLLILLIYSNLLQAYNLEHDSLKTTTDSLAVDSLAVNDSTTVITDTLKPLLLRAIGDDAQTYYIDNTEIERTDYRYIGDVVNFLPGGFLLDLGAFRQPNEITMYGLGYNNINWMLDGLTLNNRITNSVNGYNVQLEQADSIEVFPLSEGFLYGNFSNSVSLNLITRDKIYGRPLTRVRYHQAPDDEGLVDVLFSSFITPKLNGVFHFTNTNVSSVYENSNSGSWQTSLRLKYLFHNNLNIFFRYDYLDTYEELNGGVNRNEIVEADVNETMYNSIQAPVYYPYISGFESSRYQKTTRHLANVKFVNRFGSFMYNNLDLYYTYNLDEFRQDEYNQLDNVNYRFLEKEYQAAGLNLRSDLQYSGFKLQLFGNYEFLTTTFPNVWYDDDGTSGNREMSFSNFSIAGKLSFNYSKRTAISTYARLSVYDDNFYEGLGANINIDLYKGYAVYGGIAHYQRPYNQFFAAIGKDEAENNNLVEAGIKSVNKYLEAKVGVYYVDTDDKMIPYADAPDSTELVSEFSGYFKKHKLSNFGLNLHAKGKIWVLEYFANVNYTIQDDETEDEIFPPLTITGGIYYTNIHFDRALNIKTGFNFYYNDYQKFYTYDPFMSMKLNYYNDNGSLKLINDEYTRRGLTTDFFLAGEIQQSATIYFVFENFLNRKHYIVPYYPLQDSGIRLGFTWYLFD